MGKDKSSKNVSKSSGDGSIKSEGTVAVNFIRPEKKTPPIDTSSWPLLLKNYSRLNVRTGHYVPSPDGCSPLNRTLNEYLSYGPRATEKKKLILAGQLDKKGKPNESTPSSWTKHEGYTPKLVGDDGKGTGASTEESPSESKKRKRDKEGDETSAAAEGEEATQSKKKNKDKSADDDEENAEEEETPKEKKKKSKEVKTDDDDEVQTKKSSKKRKSSVAEE
eukprot:Selendium_serpulae@DN3257_c0_g1_i5.p1